MPLSALFETIAQIGRFTRRWDDDFCDKLNHVLSPIVLLSMTIVVSLKQYVGEPIVCWCEGTWSGAMIDYAHQICWVSNTYYLPPHKAPLQPSDLREQVLIYYQWVPFILLGQAFFFLLPGLLWNMMSQFIGLDPNRVARTVSGMDNVNPEVRDKTVRCLVKQIDRSLAISVWRTRGKITDCMKKAHNLLCIIGCGRGFGNYLISLYIFCKLIYIGNSVGQLFGLNFLLGTEQLGIHFLYYGVYALGLLISGQDISNGNKVFPRVTMCDFTIRQMANLHQYTIECTLPINLFNEKIFLFIWIWLVLVTFINFLSLLFWLSSLFTISRTAYVNKYLFISERMRRRPCDKKHLRCFTEYYLRQDGVFLIRMLSKNTSDVVVSEVVCKLWDHFILHHSRRAEFHRNLCVTEGLELEIMVSDRNGNPENNGINSTTPTTPGNIFP